MSYYYQQSGRREQVSDYMKELVLQKLSIGLVLAGTISFFVALYEIPPIFFFLAFFVEIIAIIGYFFAKSENTLETLYYMFVASSAVLLGYFLKAFLYIDGGLNLVFYAVGMTALIVGGVYYYTATRRPDVSGMVKYLFPLGLIFIVVMIGSLFITTSSTANILISFFGALLFSLYLYYDFGRVMSGQIRSPARMAFSLYWDILLIFKFILRMLLAMQSD